MIVNLIGKMGTILIVTLMFNDVYAGEGLKGAVTNINDLTSEIAAVVTAIATLVLVVLGLAIMKGATSFHRVSNWIYGCLIVGSASAITQIFFGGF